MRLAGGVTLGAAIGEVGAAGRGWVARAVTRSPKIRIAANGLPVIAPASGRAICRITSEMVKEAQEDEIAWGEVSGRY